MFAERDKHYPSRSGQTSLATAVVNITKPVTKNNFGPSTCWLCSPWSESWDPLSTASVDIQYAWHPWLLHWLIIDSSEEFSPLDNCLLVVWHNDLPPLLAAEVCICSTRHTYFKLINFLLRERGRGRGRGGAGILIPQGNVARGFLLISRLVDEIAR